VRRLQASGFFFLLGGAALLAWAAGCGDDGGGGRDGGGSSVSALLPLAVGASWTYRVTDAVSGTVEDKSQTVTSTQRLEGVDGDVFELVTGRTDGDRTESYQQSTAAGVVRFREETFSGQALQQGERYAPAKLRVPALTDVGASVAQTFSVTKYDASGAATVPSAKTEIWVLEATETITVPAGTFDTVRLRRTGAKNEKRYWFARGVGKVREEGTGQTEELESYEVP